MPRLIHSAEIVLDWADLDNRIERPIVLFPRSPGKHLSGIIRAKMIADGKWTEDDEKDEMPLRVAMGAAWENWVVGLWPKMDWQPKPISRDEIHGSPDGNSRLWLCSKCYMPASDEAVEMELDCPCGLGAWQTFKVKEEFKMTWKSAWTHPIERENVWIWQGAGYLCMDQPAKVAARNGGLTRFHIGWVNGDYRPPSPRYATYLMRYEQEELDGFWQNVVLPNKDKARAEVPKSLLAVDPVHGPYCPASRMMSNIAAEGDKGDKGAEGNKRDKGDKVMVYCGQLRGHGGECEFSRAI